MVTVVVNLTTLGSILAITELVTRFKSFVTFDLSVFYKPFIKEYIFKVNIL